MESHQAAAPAADEGDEDADELNAATMPVCSFGRAIYMIGDGLCLSCQTRLLKGWKAGCAGSLRLSEAEVHWRAFLDSLVARGLRGVEFIVSDDHAGLRAARRAVFGGAKWQRCQFHLAQNAIHHAPNAQIRARIGSELRQIWNQPALAKAEAALAELVASYQACAPKLAAWLEQSVPEGLAVFSLPESHQKRMRTSNPIERSIQQEVKRRTVKVRVFPSEDSLLRLVSAILVEIDEKWAGQHQPYIKWDHQNA